MNLKCNCCDGRYNSFDVHFTKACDNDCAHCVDKCYAGIDQTAPDVDAIARTIIDNSKGFDDVLFLGGEPCLYLAELLDCARQIKAATGLKVYVTTSVPKTCSDQYDLFRAVIEEFDGVNLSVQHYDESIADAIRRTVSKYDRQAFYNALPHKEKIRINLNIVKPFLYERADIEACLRHYDRMGFNSIKLSEIQHGTDHFVSFEKTFGIKMKSPFAHGCQTFIETKDILPGFKTPLLLKRSCFMCEETLNASVADCVKAIAQMAITQPNKYAVVYEDGSMKGGWV